MLKIEISAAEYEELPDVLRDEYATNDEKTYTLDIDRAISDEDVTGLKSALKKERQNRRNLERQLAEEGGAADSEELETLRTEHETLQTEHEELQATAATYDKTIRHYTKTMVIEQAAAQFNAVDADQLTKIVNDAIQVEYNDDGEPFAYVLDEDGETKLTPAAYIERMRDSREHQNLFKSTMRSGGGTPPGSNDGGRHSGVAPTSRAKMSRKEKVAYIREHGEDKYFQLPA